MALMGHILNLGALSFSLFFQLYFYLCIHCSIFFFFL